jgi:hypothetical protein
MTSLSNDLQTERENHRKSLDRQNQINSERGQELFQREAEIKKLQGANGELYKINQGQTEKIVEFQTRLNLLGGYEDEVKKKQEQLEGLLKQIAEEEKKLAALQDSMRLASAGAPANEIGSGQEKK